jgi:glucan phosphoethanolaminetransferase (alkaline phosphatase superfamily)
VIRSFIKPGEPIGAFAWKQTLFVVGSTVAFGLLLIPAGLIVALLALILISAAGSHYFKFDWKAVGALVVLVVFCALVFVKGLGVPMPLLGTWFGG